MFIFVFPKNASLIYGLYNSYNNFIKYDFTVDFLENFIKRGYFYQCTDLDRLKEVTNTKKIAAYVGFDCTANSLHVGNLMQIMILRLLQQSGHKPIVIVGGATTKIGDPSGKDETRKVLSPEELERNILGIKRSLSKFINFGEGETDAIMVNNSSWLEGLGYIEFLSNYGRLFSINRMLTMDSVRLRLERQQPLTFLEFNYMLLQAYDFYHLHKQYDCVLQFGGSDQWGNIVTGVDLIRRLTGNESWGITTPLLTTSSGAKMGKSANGAIWLNEDMLSAYDYYQYWRNCEDPDILRFAKLYAEFSDSELTEFENLLTADINGAKKHLAHSLTALCHGVEAADAAAKTAKEVFEDGLIDANLQAVDMDRARLDSGVPAFELFFETGIAESKSESRRLIRGGGAKINDRKIEDENMLVTSAWLKPSSAQDGAMVMKLSSGKKKHLLVRVLE